MANVDQNLLIKNAQGAIGKEVVFKKVNGKTLATKYPDRSGIKLSVSQESCQNIFKAAVTFAQTVMADEQLKKAWKKKLDNHKSTRGMSVYHAAIQDYMRQNSPKAKEREVQAILEKWRVKYQLSGRQLQGLDFFLRYQQLSHSIYKQLNGVSKPTATRDLQDLVAIGLLAVSGHGAGTCYSLSEIENHP